MDFTTGNIWIEAVFSALPIFGPVVAVVAAGLVHQHTKRFGRFVRAAAATGVFLVSVAVLVGPVFVGIANMTDTMQDRFTAEVERVYGIELTAAQADELIDYLGYQYSDPESRSDRVQFYGAAAVDGQSVQLVWDGSQWILVEEGVLAELPRV